jgi:hypothetical protein
MDMKHQEVKVPLSNSTAVPLPNYAAPRLMPYYGEASDNTNHIKPFYDWRKKLFPDKFESFFKLNRTPFQPIQSVFGNNRNKLFKPIVKVREAVKKPEKTEAVAEEIVAKPATDTPFPQKKLDDAVKDVINELKLNTNA